MIFKLLPFFLAVSLLTTGCGNIARPYNKENWTVEESFVLDNYSPAYFVLRHNETGARFLISRSGAMIELKNKPLAE